MYAHYINKWQVFCTVAKINCMTPEIAQVLRFLRTLEDEGLGFGAINTARSALSVVLPRTNGETVGKNYVIHLLMRSVYERNPPKPRYARFWDVSLVFDLFKDWPDNKDLSVRDLGFKVAVLILLITGHRGQTVIALNIGAMEIYTDEIVFELDKLLKSNRMGDPLSTVTLQAFPDNKKLCVVRAIRKYVVVTQKLRKSNQLLLSFIRPHGPISRDTLARWTIRVLAKAGVDTKKYSAHSTRGAVASNAKALGVSVKNILANAGWKTAVAFARHYNKKVERKDDMASKLLKK